MSKSALLSHIHPHVPQIQTHGSGRRLPVRTPSAQLANRRPSGPRQDKPILSSRVADEVFKCRWNSVVRDAAEEEAVAAIQDVEAHAVAQG